LQAISFFKSIITLESHLFINIFMNSIRISFAITAFYENGTIHGIMLLSSTREEMVRSCQSKEALRFFLWLLNSTSSVLLTSIYFRSAVTWTRNLTSFSAPTPPCSCGVQYIYIYIINHGCPDQLRASRLILLVLKLIII